MIRHFALALALLVPLAAHSQVDATDLTAVFVDGGVKIDRLLVYQIGGVVLLRGRTGNPLMAAEAGRFATRSGYRRVTNLIEIVPALTDKALVKSARHELDMARELEGCRFQIESAAGIVRLRGHVVREVQRGLRRLPDRQDRRREAGAFRADAVRAGGLGTQS